MRTINNLFCAATTPFDAKGNIDYSGLKKNLKWYYDQGIYGIVSCGGTGEFVSLDSMERIKLVDFTAENLPENLGFVVGCASETTADAVKYAKQAEHVNADGILLIASYYFKPSQEELYQHFKTVAEAINIPVILYNNPGSCGTNLTAEMVERLSKIDNIKYLKEATGDRSHFSDIKNRVSDDFNMMIGCDAIAYDLMEMGARGWVSISSNALPSQCQKLFDLYNNGYKTESKEIFKKYTSIFNICEGTYKAIQSVKFMMDCLGAIGGESRLPRQPLSKIEKEKILSILKETELI